MAEAGLDRATRRYTAKRDGGEASKVKPVDVRAESEHGGDERRSRQGEGKGEKGRAGLK